MPFIVPCRSRFDGTRALEKLYRTRWRHRDNGRHVVLIAQRRRLLGLAAEGGGATAGVLRAADTPVEMNARRQSSRLNGDDLADLFALSSIAFLASVKGVEKSRAAPALRHKRDAVELRIEDDGPRKGMCVAHPQWAVSFRRTS